MADINQVVSSVSALIADMSKTEAKQFLDDLIAEFEGQSEALGDEIEDEGEEEETAEDEAALDPDKE